MKKTVLFLSALSLLGACGGGGGTLLPVPPAPPSEPAPQTDNGYLVSNELRKDNSGAVIAGPTGEISKGALSQDANGALKVNGEVLASEFVRGQELRHTTYGHWQKLDDVSVSEVYASYGDVTPASDLPDEEASYLGISRGYVRDNADEILARSASAVRVDVRNGFRDVTIDSSTTAVTDLNSQITKLNPAYDFTGKGQITGSGFEMRIQNNDAALDLSGTTQGQFYGPNAEEVGGVFKMTGTNGSAYVGSFGATR
ncbi:MAG: transferrin-binding protein-like solute binding protein [Mangrovicoccus sp.]|nr:transferrin-binding protein-like solute binding protein [Mangrovicoccus sp.]